MLDACAAEMQARDRQGTRATEARPSTTSHATTRGCSEGPHCTSQTTGSPVSTGGAAESVDGLCVVEVGESVATTEPPEDGCVSEATVTPPPAG